MIEMNELILFFLDASLCYAYEKEKDDYFVMKTI